MKIFSNYLNLLRDRITEDDFRFKVQFSAVYAVLAIVAFIMTVLNIATSKHSPTLATLIFTVFCLVSLFCSVKMNINKNVPVITFSVAIVALFTYFIVSGIPEGFSVMWICMLPSCGLLLFGRRNGTIVCSAMLLLLLFFFHTPLGLSLLQYQYTESFKMRFPLLYVAFYFVSWLLETVRVLTHQALVKSEEKYRYLCSHDALTKVYNRYGLNRLMQEISDGDNKSSITFMIVDIDRFKLVNDRYGHMSGDIVLQKVAEMITHSAHNIGTICRWGGEEFAILIERGMTADEMHSCAEEIRDFIEKNPIDICGDKLSLTVSIGVAAAGNVDAAGLSRTLSVADECLYRAKRDGRNRVACEAI